MTVQYFGTDGIRGVFGKDPISESFMESLGAAIIKQIDKENPTIVIGHDTRKSGPLLVNALTSTLTSSGAHVIKLGTVPTAAVPLNLLKLNADLGIAVTASHNPASDNGLKFFNNKGYKLTTQEEKSLENHINEQAPLNKKQGQEETLDGTFTYIDHIKSCFSGLSLKGQIIAVDAANGATFKTTPTLLTHFGAQIITTGVTPNGNNINQGLGSEHPEKLATLVKDSPATVGIAHDGDGDRVVFCDETGCIVDGDEILGIIAIHKKAATLVTTIQSNVGLETSLKAHNITLERTDVGDRNVLYQMLKTEATIGGENSGHIIFKNILPTGDGLVAALTILSIMTQTKQPLSQLRHAVTLFPQVTDALVVKEKKPLETLLHLNQAKKTLESQLQDQGRTLIRYSGTEPKLRFLVEGPDKDFIIQGISSLKEAASKDFF